VQHSRLAVCSSPARSQQQQPQQPQHRPLYREISLAAGMGPTLQQHAQAMQAAQQQAAASAPAARDTAAPAAAAAAPPTSLAAAFRRLQEEMFAQEASAARLASSAAALAAAAPAPKRAAEGPAADEPASKRGRGCDADASDAVRTQLQAAAQLAASVQATVKRASGQVLPLAMELLLAKQQLAASCAGAEQLRQQARRCEQQARGLEASLASARQQNAWLSAALAHKSQQAERLREELVALATRQQGQPAAAGQMLAAINRMMSAVSASAGLGDAEKYGLATCGAELLQLVCSGGGMAGA
jgi:hypothetical protein